MPVCFLSSKPALKLGHNLSTADFYCTCSLSSILSNGTLVRIGGISNKNAFITKPEAELEWFDFSVSKNIPLSELNSVISL